jgi:hypothetical protein
MGMICPCKIIQATRVVYLSSPELCVHFYIYYMGLWWDLWLAIFAHALKTALCSCFAMRDCAGMAALILPECVGTARFLAVFTGQKAAARARTRTRKCENRGFLCPEDPRIRWARYLAEVPGVLGCIEATYISSGSNPGKSGQEIGWLQQGWEVVVEFIILHVMTHDSVSARHKLYALLLNQLSIYKCKMISIVGNDGPATFASTK